MNIGTKLVLSGLILMFIACAAAIVAGMADETLMEAWVICQPGSYVNVRTKPSSRSECMGRFESGDRVYLDGIVQNGFAHCVRLALEDTEGWIHLGYLVADKPELKNGAWYRIRSNGRVAVRRSIDGDRTAWLKNGSELQVLWMSDEWSLTTRGFVKTEYLEAKEENDNG